MDFGTVGGDGTALSCASSLDSQAKQRLYASGIFKTVRSSVSDDEWKSSKLAKTDDFSASKEMQKGGVFPSVIRSNNLSGNSSTAVRQEQQQMLCFSSPKTESTLPYYNYTASASSPSSNYSGFNLGSLSVSNHPGVVGGSCRGVGFTPSQWMELEQQALIYKYINANIPVPSNLLIPIKKAFESAGFSFFHGGALLRPNNNSLGWGNFHLGFSGSSDPEPGRCRRTDGKKWRCSKDAMPDQKYCDRHMNRGRHRSRKPVEGKSATATTAKEGSTAVLPPFASSASARAGPPPSAAYQMQPGILEKPPNSTATFSNDIKPKENPFLLMQHDNEFPRSSNTLFGNLGTLKELTDRETSLHPSIHHRFLSNDWPPPETHLSISMMSSSDQEKLALLPLNLGMGSFEEDTKLQTNWGQISVGGPLGEVLQNANSSSSSSTECKNSSGLHLMMDGWERSSPAGSYSSPTAVLQKSAFESVSNSSAGSSPRVA